VKKCMEYEVEGSRPRGRPKRTWKEVVREDCQARKLNKEDADLLTVRGVAHLVVHGTSGSTSYETTPHVLLEISGDVLSTADMVVQRRDGPRRLREIDDDVDRCKWRKVIKEVR